MTLMESQLGLSVSTSQLGRYEMVKLALEWIEIMTKCDEEYKKFTQQELINKALSDVVTNIATHKKIDELRKNVKKETNPE